MPSKQWKQIERNWANQLLPRNPKDIVEARMASEANRNKLPIVCQSHKQEGKRELRHIVSMDLDVFNILAKTYMHGKEPPIDTGKDLAV